MDMAKIREIDAKAKKLMGIYLPPYWQFAWNTNKSRLGVCRYGQKMIELSAVFANKLEIAETNDTILHEIAHAICWEKYNRNCGHRLEWKKEAIRIGARPRACYSGLPTELKARYFADCCQRYYYNRRPKYPIYKCNKCGNWIRFVDGLNNRFTHSDDEYNLAMSRVNRKSNIEKLAEMFG